MRGIERGRARAAGGNRGRPKPAAQTYRAGTDCPRLGRSASGAAGARSIGVSPTAACWLDAVENFFSKMTRQRIRRGIFRSVVDLQAAINAYVTEHNANPKPFVRTKSAEAVLAKLARCPVPSV